MKALFTDIGELQTWYWLAYIYWDARRNAGLPKVYSYSFFKRISGQQIIYLFHNKVDMTF